MNTPSTFTIGVNRKIVGKCDPQKLSYSGAFQSEAHIMASLAGHISQGYPWMPGLLGGNGKRWQANVTRAEVLGADIDGGLTIEQALADPFITAHAGLLIESSSSTPELNKFRLVFRLTEAVEGWQDVRICNRYLIHLLGTADPACKDASRFFFGGLGRTAYLVNESATLAPSFVADALAWHEAEEKQLQAQRAARAAKAALWVAEHGEDAQIELVQSALDSLRPYTPNEGRYGELSTAIAGLCNELGTVGEQMAIAWDGGRGLWGRPFEEWLASLLRTSGTAGVGSLFYLAKHEGWRRPVKNSVVGSRPNPTTPIKELDTSAADAEQERCIEAEGKESDVQDVLSFFGYTARKARKQLEKIAKREPSAPESDVHEFEPNGRQAAIEQAISEDYKHILDISGTGAGKSTFVGEAKAEQLGVERLFYLTKESRKPSTIGIEKNYTPLPVRNGGMFRDTKQFTPMGKAVVRHPKAGEQADIDGNCVQPELFHKFAALGINVEGESNPICMGCPKQDFCKLAPGWFKNDRRVALSHSQITAHPQSLNSPSSFEYKETGLVWEEAGELVQYRDEMEIGQSDVEQAIGAIALDEPELYQQLTPVLSSVRGLMNAEGPGRYGWNDKALAEALPQIEQSVIDGLQASVESYYQGLQDAAFLEAVTKADTAELTKAIAAIKGKIERRQLKAQVLQSQLNKAGQVIAAYRDAELFGNAPTSAQLNDAENIPSKIRALETELSDLQKALEFTEGTRETEVEAARDDNTQKRAEKHKSLGSEVQKRWLSHFLSALGREHGHSFRMQNGRLTVSYPVTRYQDIAKAAKFNLYLDATLTRDRLAKMLGIPEEELYVIRQKGTEAKKPDNLRVIQIADRGKFGRQRSSESIKATITALTTHVQQQHPGAGIIDYKSADSKHYWFRDNRGSNEFQNSPALLTIGTPCPNLAALEADYIALTGDRPTGKDDPKWRAFCTEAIDAEFIQAAGRLRAQHRPEQQLTYYIASNHPLPAELGTEQVRARDICIEAGTPAEQQWHLISKALSKLGSLPTQAEISQLLGIAQGQISKLAQQFAGGWQYLKKIFQTLIETNKANGIFLKMPESEQQQALEHTELLEAIATDPPDPGGESINFLIDLFKSIGHRAFAIAASQLSPLNRGNLLKKLLEEPDLCSVDTFPDGWKAI